MINKINNNLMRIHS